MNVSRFRLSGVLIALVTLAGSLSAAPQAGRKGPRTSPPYTVMVALQVTSPYVADGRMSFADLAFSATFTGVVFYLGEEGPGVVENHGGKLHLTRHAFNDVYDGDSRHKPWVKKEWPMEFGASLLDGWTERDEEEGEETDGDDIPLVPLVRDKVRMGFHARFGLLDLEWFSKLGSNVLSSMLFEFEVPWKPLFAGQPVTLKLPYEDGDPEDKGEWWIEFIPAKK